MVCPEESYVLGACDTSECGIDADCDGETLCCPNNCYQQVCVEPIALLPACGSIVSRLSPNVSYIPECDESGEYLPQQCAEIEMTEKCWCVNVLSGVPYTRASSDASLECTSKCPV